MTQENKELLLLKDLCARLSYGVKCDVNDNKPYTLRSIDTDHLGCITWVSFREHKNGRIKETYLSICKPYLFPLSSMTEEQKREYIELLQIGPATGIDYLNKNHFDYRGLIPMGLAIDCTNLNIY